MLVIGSFAARGPSLQRVDRCSKATFDATFLWVKRTMNFPKAATPVPKPSVFLFAAAALPFPSASPVARDLLTQKLEHDGSAVTGDPSAVRSLARLHGPPLLPFQASLRSTTRRSSVWRRQQIAPARARAPAESVKESALEKKEPKEPEEPGCPATSLR